MVLHKHMPSKAVCSSVEIPGGHNPKVLGQELRLNFKFSKPSLTQQDQDDDEQRKMNEMNTLLAEDFFVFLILHVFHNNWWMMMLRGMTRAALLQIENKNDLMATNEDISYIMLWPIFQTVDNKRDNIIMLTFKINLETTCRDMVSIHQNSGTEIILFKNMLVLCFLRSCFTRKKDT
ncbi:hypothetical protein ACJX0J_032354, partial [Zea mays]